jgi:hypothetical protein
MKYQWTQQYPPNSKYERLYYAQRLIEISKLVILLDQLEPITDLTEANTYLDKFKLEK